MERWAQKCAIVTGAASGIGKEITISLLKNKINVLALDVNTEKLSLLNHEWMQLEGSNKLCIMRCNISNEKDLERAFSFMETEWNSGVDIMVNNAGVIELSRIIGKIIHNNCNEKKRNNIFKYLFKNAQSIIFIYLFFNS